jgi:hypothetical protein
MRLSELLEAPIGDIFLHGDFSRAGSFRQDDLSLASAKRQDKIKRVLQKAPVLIDLHFVNLTQRINIRTHLEPQWPPIKGYMSSAELADRWNINIAPQSNAFNLVSLQNEGDARIPLTPWIIAHRLSHAFEYGDRFAQRAILDEFYRRLNRVSDFYSKRQFGLIFKQLPHIFGTTKACREDKVIREGEWFHDCFAQMCVVGDIRFNPAPHDIAGHTTDPTIIDQEFVALRQTMLTGFKQLLERGIGKILVL